MGVEMVMREIKTASAAEEVQRMAMRCSERKPLAAQEAAWRAVRAKDVILMRTMEAQVEMMDKIEEEQRGQSKRAASTSFSDRRDTTGTSAWKAAYTAAADGKPNMAFIHYYTAVAAYSGVIVHAV